MGLDVGGGGARCLLLDVAGGDPLVASRGWSAFGGSGVDLDLEALFAKLAEASRAALALAGADAEVTGLAVSALRFGGVVIDRAGHPVLAVSNRDSRAALEALTLAAEAGEELQQRTGHWPVAVGAAAQLRALAKRGELGEARAHLALNDWVAWRHTGELAPDRSQAGATGLWNMAPDDWDQVPLTRVGEERS
jgi:autoinducer 2 (AI-2) kinase